MLFKGFVKSEMGMSFEEFVASKPNDSQLQELITEYEKDCARRKIKPLFDVRDKSLLKTKGAK